MEIDFQTILRKFISNFIPAEEMEQAVVELVHAKNRSLFLERLAAEGFRIMDSDVVKPMDKEIVNRAAIRNELRISEYGLCYVISSNTALDNKVMEFNSAFDKIYDQGYAAIILNLSADALYAEFKPADSSAERFIGKA
jgi:hypothetical protein